MSEQTHDDVLAIIRSAITNHPRSQQTQIGPSELGNPCDHCLAAKLAGWPQTEATIPWHTTVGTAVHAWLEEQVLLADVERLKKAGDVRFPRWLCEEQVTVGSIGGTEITGSFDLFDTETGTVVDYKTTAKVKLAALRNNMTVTYRTQVHLYGLGLANAGHTVRAVSILFLPRDALALNDHLYWSEPWNRTVAEESLARANRIHDNLAALTAFGTGARDAWITGLPRAPRCFDCNRYPDRTSTVHAQDGVADLLPTE